MALLGAGFFKTAPGGTGGTGGGGFTPYTESYNNGNGTSLVPAGATQLVVEIYSRGGGGGAKLTGNGGGGGSGAYAKKIFVVDAGDIGKTITWNTDDATKALVHGDAAGVNITDVTLAMQCTNGVTGTSTTGGAGGAASGGSTNFNGAAGQSAAAGGNGANAPGPGGGAGGAAGGQAGVDPGGGGGGGDADTGGGPGGKPRIVLSWT